MRFPPDRFTLLSLLVTIALYALARAVHSRAPLAIQRGVPPLVASLIFVVIALKIGHVDMARYRAATQILVWCLAPATVALAIPLMKSPQLWRQIKPIGAAIVLGLLANLAWTWLICRIFGVAPQLEASLRPKTSTAAIALEIASRSGGVAAAGAAFAVLCGVLGSWFYPLLWPRSNAPEALGIAVGTVAHGIGTSRLAAETTTAQNGATAASAFAMALSGILTALLLTPWMWS